MVKLDKFEFYLRINWNCIGQPPRFALSKIIINGTTMEQNKDSLKQTQN